MIPHIVLLQRNMWQSAMPYKSYIVTKKYIMLLTQFLVKRQPSKTLLDTSMIT